MKHASLVGTSIATASGVPLEIIGHNGLKGNSSKHLFFCKVCANDAELYGRGVFWSQINNILHKDSTPCGCGQSPRWTEWQYYVRCKRSAIAKDLYFYGWDEPFHGWKTRLSIYCKKHGKLNSATTSSLVSAGQGCRKCYEIRIGERAASDREAEEKYLEKCGYPKGSSLRRLPLKDEYGNRSIFEVTCYLCARDEYAKAGLCNGVFRTKIESLCAGLKSCRCSTTKAKPEWLARHQCESLLEDSGIQFIGWKDGYKNSRSKVVARCSIHGEFYPMPQTILRGSRCPGCSKGGYTTTKKGFVYLLSSSCDTRMKIGITNNFEKRHRHLTHVTPFAFYVVGVKQTSGEFAPILERRLLDRSKRLSYEGFNGASEWIEWDESLREYFMK